MTRALMSLKSALMLGLLAMTCQTATAAAADVERLSPSIEDVPSHLALRAGAHFADDPAEHELQLPGNAYAEWKAQQAFHTDAGTFSLWVKPLWPAGDTRSHTFATFGWQGTDQSYFALSQGWWEPIGAQKLYVVLSNQQYVFCFMPYEFNYTFYLSDQWTMLGVTWQAGDPGFIRLYVDGKRICERRLTFTGGRQALDPIYLGSDRGSTVGPGTRTAEMVIKDVFAAPTPASDESIRRAYASGGGVNRPKWILAIAAKDPHVDIAHERRVMQDEQTAWASSKLEIQRRVMRIKAAGFNVYMPSIWDGRAYFATSVAPVAPGILDPTDPTYDPLKYLIAFAHQQGIAVHPWIIVGRRAPESPLPASYSEGAPDQAYNVHSDVFRNFIVGLVADVASRYDVDGINLDYIRAMGLCSSRECDDAYRKKYGRSLVEDWKSQQQGTDVPSVIEWNRSAVTAIVRRMSASVRKFKPHAVLTIDTVPFDRDRQYQGVDEAGWLHDGLIDDLLDMSYEDPIDIDRLDHAMKVFSPSRQVVVVRDYDWYGDTLSERSGEVMADYVRLIRTRWPGAGIAFYHYMHMPSQQIDILGSGVFAQAATSLWTH